MTNYLYHYTKPDRLRFICEKGEGLMGGSPQCSVVLSPDDSEDYGDMDSEVMAEDELNQVLTENRPAKYRKYSRHGVYFWPRPHWSDQNHRCELKVDPSKLDTDALYIADAEITDDLFDKVQQSDYDPNEPDSALDAIAKSYWDSLRPYSSSAHSKSTQSDEVVYNGVVPVEAIISIEGDDCSIKNLGEQMRLEKYTPIQRAMEAV